MTRDEKTPEQVKGGKMIVENKENLKDYRIITAHPLISLFCFQSIKINLAWNNYFSYTFSTLHALTLFWKWIIFHVSDMYFLWSLEQIEEFGMFWPNRLFDQTVLAKPFVTANRGWPLCNALGWANIDGLGV